MTLVGRFEDLLVWQKAQALSVSIYRVFGKNKDFGFKDQIQRATVSIMNNVAEGFDRKGTKEFERFLYIAKGSCAEVRSMLYLARELGYLSDGQQPEMLALTEELSRMIGGLIRSLHRS
jgi:four helix bundle protein